MTKKLVVLILFLVGLIYLVVPGPTRIQDFPALPNSFKSIEEGDTIQYPNISAYYSDFKRSFITQFYRQALSRDVFLVGNLFPPLTLNHPPEDAHTLVRKYLENTFTEEYLYPLRESLLASGYEPLVENGGRHYNKYSDYVYVPAVDNFFNSKTTIRFYPTKVYNRIFVYLGIWGAIFGLIFVVKKALKEKYR